MSKSVLSKQHQKRTFLVKSRFFLYSEIPPLPPCSLDSIILELCYSSIPIISLFQRSRYLKSYLLVKKINVVVIKTLNKIIHFFWFSSFGRILTPSSAWVLASCFLLSCLVSYHKHLEFLEIVFAEKSNKLFIRRSKQQPWCFLNNVNECWILSWLSF